MGTQGMINLELRIDRPSKIYHENEDVTGSVIVTSKTEFKHEGFLLELEGNVQMQLSGKNIGVLDAFSSSARPIQLTSWSDEIVKGGKLFVGRTEFPFRAPLEPKLNRTLFETYHGVYIAVQYAVKCDIKRSFPNKTLSRTAEFIVEYTPTDDRQTIYFLDHYDVVVSMSPFVCPRKTARSFFNDPFQKDKETEHSMEKPIAFTITPESVQNKERSTLPNFNLTGKLDSCSCSLARPLTGEVTLHRSDRPLKSVEIQLIRVETCGGVEGYSRDATEIQTLQIAEGDILKGISVPIYMVFPRLFTCPTLETPNFKIEFELNLIIVFDNGYMVSENFPITLHRY